MSRANLQKSLDNFLDINDKIAKKYKGKVTIGFTSPMGEKKEVVIADHTKKKTGGANE